MTSKRFWGSLSGGIFLIGLGLLFLIPGASFWPWILVVVGVSQLPAALSGKQRWMGWHGFFWMVGLALLFWSGHFWPGILILVGISAIIEALMHERERFPATAGASSGQEPFGIADLPKDNGGWR